jgi:hypothetical protein
MTANLRSRTSTDDEDEIRKPRDEPRCKRFALVTDLLASTNEELGMTVQIGAVRRALTSGAARSFGRCFNGGRMAGGC